MENFPLYHERPDRKPHTLGKPYLDSHKSAAYTPHSAPSNLLLFFVPGRREGGGGERRYASMLGEIFISMLFTVF
jgi:hypothetical protein